MIRSSTKRFFSENSIVHVLIDFLDHQGNPERLTFNDPREIIKAGSLSEVIPAVAAAEAAAANGFYAAGFISYEAAPAFDHSLSVMALSDFPLVWFGIFETKNSVRPANVPCSPANTRWTPEISRSEYDDAIDRIHCSIQNGETYQTNYTFRLRSTLKCDLLGYYRHLHDAHPCPYSAFIDTGDFTIISNSPELFLSVSAEKIKSEPMKGTNLRGRYAAEDCARADQLANSVKDRAEHVMIVDLVRSDLGKVAKAGTVSVEQGFSLRCLPTVWQMVSTVAAARKDGLAVLDILKAAFPAGSVTGAPKAKTMEIIRREEISPRKVYCGAIGYLGPDGRAAFNVPIRTIIVDNLTGASECGVGGGITSGSNATGEYAESIAKSQFLKASPQDFELLESLLLEEGAFFLLEEHLARLGRAASYFAFPADISAARKMLAQCASGRPAGLFKVRLTIDSKGSMHVSSAPVTEIYPQVVRLARSPIDTGSPFVFHKTTKRDLYDIHRNANSDVYDVLLWNDDGQITEFTTANVVVELEGVKYTPPISNGLLAGTFRKRLIETGEIVERVVELSEVKRAQRIWLINSVRRWVAVRLIEN